MNLVYSKWSEYSSCTKTCGEGEQSRTRTCIGGICSRASSSDLIETKVCSENDCTILTSWNDWASCSVTCGEGLRIRTRECNQGCTDVPADNLRQEEICHEIDCPALCFRVESNCQASGSKQAKISFWHNNVKIDNIEAGFKEFEHCFPSNSFDVEKDRIKLHINGEPWSTNGVRFINIF